MALLISCVLSPRLLLHRMGRHDLSDLVHNAQHQVQAVGHIAGIIHAADLVCQAFPPLNIKLVPRLRNLISDGIHDHAGMIVILVYHALHIMLPPVRHVGAVVKIHLRGSPHVGKFLHNQHALAVAGFQEAAAHGVVGTAHCVKSRLFQLADSTIRRVGVLRRSDNSVVVMDAAAPQFYGFSIDPESMAGIQLQPADTEGSLLLIQNLILLQNAGPVSIQIRMIRIPELRIVHVQLLTVTLSGLLCQGNRHGGGRHRLSLRVQKLHSQDNVPHITALIRDAELRADHCQFSVRLHCRQMDALRRQMQTVRNHQIDIR